jgi:uncharacterized protein (TIGR02270 family)
MPMPPSLTILSQHASEASFLWELRSGAVAAPHYDLADLAKLDQRVEAHLDGLRIAGEAGWELYKDALSEGESGEIFAAAVLAFESGKSDRIETGLAAGAGSQELSRGLVSALGWLPFQQAQPHIQQLLASTSLPLRRIGVAASAIHRQDPGAPLLDAISSVDPLLRARALRATGELGLKSYLHEMKPYLADPDALCHFSAAWSIALLSGDSNADDSKALAILVSIAESDLPYRAKALQLAIRQMGAPAASAWWNKLTRDAKQIRIAIIAAGELGDPASIPWLTGQMKVPELARVCGEAFTMIAGVDIAYQDLDTDKPEDFTAGPTENPEDENVEMDADENLPWPDPELIAKWWSQHQVEFQKGTRYLLGTPISTDWCQQVLRNGRQRQRTAAALELAILQPGTPLFNVSAPGFRQMRQLGLTRKDFQRSRPDA